MPEASETPAGEHPRAWRAWLGDAAAVALGGVLLVATLAKAIDPQGFAEQLRAQHLTFGLPPLVATLGALAIEGAIGLLLLLAVRRPWTLLPAAALVALFLAITARAWWQAAHGVVADTGCGCFGNLVQRSPAAAFLEDLLLLVPLLLLAFVGRHRGPALPARRLAVAAAGLAGILLLAWRAPSLPLDDWATRLRPGVKLADVCAGAARDRVCLPDVDSGLVQGKTWVVLADVAQGGPWVDRLNALVAAAGDSGVHVLTATPSEQVKAFRWQWGPSFELHEAPPPLLRPLYRTLPRSFYVEDGRVVRTVSGLPPAASASPGEPRR